MAILHGLPLFSLLTQGGLLNLNIAAEGVGFGFQHFQQGDTAEKGRAGEDDEARDPGSPSAMWDGDRNRQFDAKHSARHLTRDVSD